MKVVFPDGRAPLKMSFGVATGEVPMATEPPAALPAPVKNGPLGIPPSVLDANGNLPPGIGGIGTPIPMPATSNPSAVAEQFARDAFNGQTPVKVKTDITGPGSWVATMPDGTVITFRPAGQASKLTDPTTATVEINSAAVRSINNGSLLKFKFPSN
jgi:filamentous hemagglutinin